MLLSIFDPDLLMYDHNDWLTEQQHVSRRMQVLAMHQRFVLRNSFSIAMSAEMEALMFEWFPWGERFKTLPDFRDFRQFILERLPRMMHHITRTKEADEITLEPNDVTCRYIDDPRVINIWKELVCAAAESRTGFQL